MSATDFLLISVIYLTTIDMFFLKKRRGSISLLTTLAVLLILGHIIFDIVRWQVLLLYAFPIYVFIYYALSHIHDEKFNKNLKKYYRLFVLFFITSSTFAMILLPIKTLEAPRGEYVIGTKTFNVKDKDRLELYGETAGEARDIRLQVWYPADSSNDQEPVKWMIDGQAVTREYAKRFHLPSFMLDHTDLVYTHSYKDLPISKKEFNYPVVVFSHGWTSSRNFHLDLAEYLASNGYIVIGIDHTYGAAATRLDGGEVAIVDYDALPVKDEENFISQAEVLVDVYSQDIKFVLDYLEVMNAEDIILKGKLNNKKIGTFGHSTGAGAGVKLAIEDDRVTAVMGMDPWVEPVSLELLKRGLDVNALFFRSEEWADNSNNEYLKVLVDNSANIKGIVQIDDSKHLDFTMLYAYSDIAKYFGLGGKYSGYEYSLIQQEFVLSFFNSVLKDIEYDVKEMVDEYEEITLTS